MSSSKKADYSLEAKWGPRIGRSSFMQIPNVLIENKVDLGITPAEWSVLIDLIYRRWTEAHPFPEAKTIGKQNGRSTSAVRRCLRSLEQKGLLKRIQRYNTSNLYDLTPLIERLENYPHRIRKQTHPSSNLNSLDYLKIDTYKDSENSTQLSRRSTSSGKVEPISELLNSRGQSP